MAISAADVVAVKCHCNVVAVDHKLDTGGGGEGHNPRLYPGMGNGAEFGQGHGDDEDDDDKDSGNGSVLEFVPPSEFQVSFSLWCWLGSGTEHEGLAKIARLSMGKHTRDSRNLGRSFSYIFVQ